MVVRAPGSRRLDAKRRGKTSIGLALLATLATLASSVGVHAETDTYVFTSVRKVPDSRVPALVAAATRHCDPFHSQAYESARFQECMLSLGWRFHEVKTTRTARDRKNAEASARHERELKKKNDDDSNDHERQMDDYLKTFDPP